MQEKKIKFTDVLFVGLAFFASYFGAGNLIFPPMLGLQSGSNWLSGMIGMLASGVGLPILAIIVLGMCGSVQKISDHVNKKFYTVMIGAIMILCCCVSIPRTAAVGIEMGLQGIWPGAPYLVFVILYFVIAFLFAKDRGTALDKVGKILTPIMTIILFILVVKGAVSPIGTPGAASVDNAFVNSFLGGYSTGDVLVSFLAAGVFFDSIKRKGCLLYTSHVQKLPALSGQGDPGSRADENRNPQLLLQRADHFADAGLGDIQDLSGFAEGAAFCHRGNILQLEQCHTKCRLSYFSMDLSYYSTRNSKCATKIIP